jgi:hypothetical protein
MLNCEARSRYDVIPQKPSRSPGEPRSYITFAAKVRRRRRRWPAAAAAAASSGTA